MLKRQDSSLSSSSRRQFVATTPPPPETHDVKSVGCMSGIFKLFSKYQNPNKRITFGRKQVKLKPPSPAKSRKPPPPAAKEDEIEEKSLDLRSPTLPPEIRRQQESIPRTPPSPSLVARLMGLEDLGAAADKPEAAEGEGENRVTEKRRRLLLALEKCNEDLEALKKIIRTVQAGDARVPKTDGRSAVDEEKNIPAVAVEEKELTRSPLNSVSVEQNSAAGATRVSHLRKTTPGKKPGENDEPIAKLLNKSSIIESSLRLRRQASAAIAPPWCSRAMVKSVEEVCGDIVWGQKREIERIGLVLQDHLCRELVEELAIELKSCNIYALPFDSCKRKLCF
ncbi:3-bisphosphoglycerate-dependent phosphoglyceratemutase [Striga asiatica]|uniref:3-bisphosphoglycerate-dependent phosphoglyceratemutase n=1 Tax=Striga asiatica TaxID=4170 RepID=A0A5A7R6S3_STRAF|nr:3-bisphosphoglycerate-dependent phosphoglyceratemutase [Striga asiatica]